MRPVSAHWADFLDHDRTFDRDLETSKVLSLYALAVLLTPRRTIAFLGVASSAFNRLLVREESEQRRRNRCASPRVLGCDIVLESECANPAN